MIARAERLLLVSAPVVAIATVGVGLRVGASDAVRAPIVTAALPAASSPNLAWQVVVLDEDQGVRQPVELPSIEVVATGPSGQARWRGPTNEDGVAEAELPIPLGPLALSVSSGGRVLARGSAAPAPPRSPPPPLSAWARFARREGAVALDVAVLGQRGESGFPASVWVHATDGASGSVLPGVVVSIDADAALTPASPSVTTDARGWAHVTATPMGYSVPLLLHARADDGRTGEWDGGLFISPGGAQIAAKDRYAPGDKIAFDVVVPTVRTTAYVEIDDASGRAWAAAPSLAGAANELPRAHLEAPAMPPGLYWIATAGDPTGAASLGPGTTARPFFVAGTDDAALRFGTDPLACAPPGDVRDGPRAVSTCLALVAPAPTARWLALDGFAYQKARDVQQRDRGVAIALSAIGIALLLEAVLLVRLAAAARSRLRAAASTEEGGRARLTGRTSGVVLAILVGLLGLGLLAAFVVRLA